MEALVISISLEVLVESVGSSFLRVVLIGSISVEVSVAPEVGVDVVASPTGLLELDTHSLSKDGPSKSSPPPVSVAPMVSPFLCSDDSESDTEILKRHVSPTLHDAMLTRWRSIAALRSSSPTTSILEIHTAPILPAPSVIVTPSFEEDIPIGRLYHTHPGGPCKALTMRKLVRPLPSYRLALRHTPPDTIDADSSTPSTFVYPSLARTPWCTRDSSFELSAGLSRKRCGSPAAIVTSSIHATRALVPSRADLLPPRKRFRDSISPEDSVEEDIDTDVLKDIEADATAIEVTVDRDVKAEVDTSIGMDVDVGIKVEDEVESSDRVTMEVRDDMVVGISILDVMLMPDAVECLDLVEEGLQDIYDHVIEIPLQRIEDIKTGQRELEAMNLIAGGERASLLEQVVSLERSNARLQDIMMMERVRVD
nr:hypothetical protein [Tanacetum cinerariifolium]